MLPLLFGSLPAPTLHSTVLPAVIGEKAVGGPMYSTTIIRGETGVEQRNVNWLDPIQKWTIETGLQQDVDFAAFVDFYRARQGRLYAWLIQDPADYQATGQLIGTGDGATTLFQLCKHYVCEVVEDRPLTRIVPGTTAIYFGGVSQSSGWTVNVNTGVVSFTTAPGAGVVITADCQFYVPVRFDVDAMQTQWQWTAGEWSSVPIVEVREQPTVPVATVSADSTNARFPVQLTGQTGGPSFDTFLVPVGSGYEERGARWTNEKLRWDLSHEAMPPATLAAVLQFFRAHKGRAYSFRFKDWRDYQVTLEASAQLTSTTFQIQHVRSSGGVNAVRTITKPVAGTVSVFNGTTNVPSGWTVDTNTGIITFTVAPGYVPNVSCQFDVLCRFDTDQLAIQRDELLVSSITGLSVVEVTS